jgi:hypothetical protein
MYSAKEIVHQYPRALTEQRGECESQQRRVLINMKM